MSHDPICCLLAEYEDSFAFARTVHMSRCSTGACIFEGHAIFATLSAASSEGIDFVWQVAYMTASDNKLES